MRKQSIIRIDPCYERRIVIPDEVSPDVPQRMIRPHFIASFWSGICLRRFGCHDNWIRRQGTCCLGIQTEAVTNYVALVALLKGLTEFDKVFKWTLGQSGQYGRHLAVPSSLTLKHSQLLILLLSPLFNLINMNE